MSDNVRCRVCERDVSLRSITSDPWPFSIRCTHCTARYGFAHTCRWRLFWLVAPIGFGIGAVVICAVLIVAVGSVAGLGGLVAGLLGLAAVVYAAMRLQIVLVRRLYERGELQLLIDDASDQHGTVARGMKCGNCGDNVSKASCPMCGSELEVVLSPVVCRKCGECIPLEEVSCSACGSAVGSQANP